MPVKKCVYLLCLSVHVFLALNSSHFEISRSFLSCTSPNSTSSPLKNRASSPIKIFNLLNMSTQAITGRYSWIPVSPTKHHPAYPKSTTSAQPPHKAPHRPRTGFLLHKHPHRHFASRQSLIHAVNPGSSLMMEWRDKAHPHGIQPITTEKHVQYPRSSCNTYQLPIPNQQFRCFSYCQSCHEPLHHQSFH